MSEDAKYRQLGMFSTIVAEVVITPGVLGGLAYWISRGTSFQTVVTPIAAVFGLVIAFYRISRLRKRFENDGS